MLVDRNIGLDPQAGAGGASSGTSGFDTIIDGLLGRRQPLSAKSIGNPSGYQSAGSGNDPKPINERPSSVPDPAKVEFYKGLSGKKGEQIVAEMEKNGALVFKGEHAGEMRQALIKNLDGSKFFKTAFLDGFGEDTDLKITYDVEELGGQTAGQKRGSSGNTSVIIDAGIIKNGTSTRLTLAHETLHASPLLRDSADMRQAMAIVRKETGIHYKDITFADEGGIAGDSYDYELFEATQDDWEEAGALLQKDYYNYNTLEMKEAMERIFGPGERDRDPTKAFSDSVQRYDRDPEKIAQAYLDAVPNGRVAAIRERQLRELGIDPALVKESGRNKENYLNGLVSDYRDLFLADNGKHLLKRTVPLTDGLERNYAGLMHYYKAINPKATDKQAADWVFKQVQARLPGAFPDGELTPDGKDNTIVDQNDNGAYANNILSGWYGKHGGQQYIIDSYHKNPSNNAGNTTV